jgi:hypothetical protein
MILPKDFIDCVCFLCTKSVENGIEKWIYGGTAFFVSVPSETHPDDYCHLYLATARHNIKDKYGSHRDLYVRLNTTDGAAKGPMRLPYNWEEPDSDAVDVAIMSFDEFDDPSLDYKHIPIASAATETAIRHHGIGLGSDVIVTGLFTKRIGSKRNIPIVRAGIISTMIGEFEDENSGLLYDGYLIELQSIGGLSGSPVFAVSNYRVAFERPQYSIRLLGLIRGHYDIQKRGDEPLDFPESDWNKIHNGISIVTPVQEILKLLERDKLVKKRRIKDRELANENAPTLDSAFPDKPSKTKADELTKEDFENVLKRASRKTSEPES